MKTKLIFICLLTLSFLVVSNQNMSAQEKKKDKETAKFYVEAMDCQNCQAKIEKNMAFEKGVTDIKTDLDNKIVVITYKTGKTNPENLKKGFNKIGYEVVEVIENNKNNP